jgi:hypothetical protein
MLTTQHVVRILHYIYMMSVLQVKERSTETATQLNQAFRVLSVASFATYLGRSSATYTSRTPLNAFYKYESDIPYRSVLAHGGQSSPPLLNRQSSLRRRIIKI